MCMRASQTPNQTEKRPEISATQIGLNKFKQTRVFDLRLMRDQASKQTNIIVSRDRLLLALF